MTDLNLKVQIELCGNVGPERMNACLVKRQHYLSSTAHIHCNLNPIVKIQVSCRVGVCAAGIYAGHCGDYVRNFQNLEGAFHSVLGQGS